MSGGKGSKPAGTVTTTNLTGQKQEPYLEEIWKAGQGLYNKYTPGSLTANEGIPWQQQGLQLQGDLARELQQEFQPTVYNAWLSAANQRAADSPAYQTYNNLAQGNAWQGGVYDRLGDAANKAGQNFADSIAGYSPEMASVARMAGANNNLGLSTLGNITQGLGAGMSQLARTAQGDYINGNPYFASMVQSALDPIVKNYQTAISPQIDGGFETAGRYGSGAMLGQRAGAAEILAGNLAKTSSGMYGQNYANERQQQLNAANQFAGLQNQAGSQYGQLYNQGVQTGLQGLQTSQNALTAAANPYFQGLSQTAANLSPNVNMMLSGAQGLQNAYQSGQQNQINAAQLYPSLAAANFLPSQQVRDAGAGINALQQQYLDEPYTALQRYQQTIGQPIGAGTQQPYFQNGMANTMAGITGGLDIMSKMGGMLGKI